LRKERGFKERRGGKCGEKTPSRGRGGIGTICTVGGTRDWEKEEA